MNTVPRAREKTTESEFVVHEGKHLRQDRMNPSPQVADQTTPDGAVAFIPPPGAMTTSTQGSIAGPMTMSQGSFSGQMTSSQGSFTGPMTSSQGSFTGPMASSQTLEAVQPTAPTVSPHGDDSEHLERNWAQFGEEDKGLLSAETKEEWAHFTDSSSRFDTSSMSSETDSIEDVWTITDEQRDYYVTQFKIMQPNVRGMISGAVAKEFFEKSRLPVLELSQIWQLADVNRDGALNLEEFCTAMHLVVLRRNDIELPEQLPPALMPYVPLNPEEPFAADLPPGSTMKVKSSPLVASTTPSSQWSSTYSRPTTQDSPTSSSISSPGSKPTPVNFDYAPIIADSESQIVHPVALRMSPDGHTVPLDSATDALRRHYDDDAAPDKLPTFMSGGPMQGRPRPTPKKAMSVPGPFHDGPGPTMLPPPARYTSPDPPASGDSATDPVPPEIPQRPKPAAASHTRSSSLGSNQLIDFSEGDERLNQTLPPPQTDPPPPPPQPETPTPGDFDDGADPRDTATPPLPAENHLTTSTPARPLRNSLAANDHKELKDAIRKQQLRNVMLTRLNSELNQELQEVMEQRIALEIQLEHLQPSTIGRGQYFVNLI